MSAIVFPIGRLGEQYDELFNEQRRSIPKAYALGNEIRHLSKLAIKAVIDDKKDDFGGYQERMLDLWNEMGTLSLPSTFREYQDFEAAQEVVEALAVYGMFKAILNGGGLSYVDWESFSPNALDMTPQAWLFGLLDAGSELSRVVNRYIMAHRPPRGFRETAHERCVVILRELNDLLDHYSEVTPAVMDAYNKYGFRQSFRSKLNQLRGAIEHQERFVFDAIERDEE